MQILNFDLIYKFIYVIQCLLYQSTIVYVNIYVEIVISMENALNGKIMLITYHTSRKVS